MQEYKAQLSQQREIPLERIQTDYYGFSDPYVEFRWIYGCGLTWETPLEGLKIGVSALRSQFKTHFRLQGGVRIYDEIDDTTNFDYEHIDLPYQWTGSIGEISTLSLEYTTDRYSIVWERERFISDSQDMSSPLGQYVQVNYRHSRLMAFSIYYSEYFIKESDKKGKFFTEMDLPDYLAWNRDICFSTRFDVSDNWLIKLEAHIMDGAANLPCDYRNCDHVRMWSMFAAKSTFHF